MASSGKWIEGVDPDTPVEEAARRSLEPRLTAVAGHLPLAAYLAEHDVEHVHQLRVATRRAAAARKLYRDLLAPKPARWLKKRLRKIRRTAGEARDLDVLIERVRRDAGPDSDPIVRFLADKRAAVQPDVVELAEEMRRDDCFVRKTAELLDAIKAPDPKDASTPATSFGEWAPQQLARIGCDFVDQIPNETVNIETLHQFRIRAKAVRYAIELLAPAFGRELRKEIYPVVEELQERLGQITDHVAAIKNFAEWLAHKGKDEPRDEANDLIEMEQKKQAEDLDDFHQWWTPDRASWLKESLAGQAACRT